MINLVCSLSVYTRLTYPYLADTEYIMGSDKDGQGDRLPGMSLAEWLRASELSYSAFSRMLPCAVAYPRKLALGLARPSYELACRIEQVTDGAVPRTRWYPPPTDKEINDPEAISIEDAIE